MCFPYQHNVITTENDNRGHTNSTIKASFIIMTTHQVNTLLTLHPAQWLYTTWNIGISLIFLIKNNLCSGQTSLAGVLPDELPYFG